MAKRPLPTKAYNNEDFIHSPDGRALRILSEYIEPSARFSRYRIDDTIVFFGSARIPSREQAEQAVQHAKKSGHGLDRAEQQLALSRYYEETRALARRLTEWSKDLDDPDRRFVVCSGGGPGIMEAANRGASEAKGLNVGLNIALPFEQQENPYISRELAFNCHYFFMRKFWFAYLAKAVVIMPGGFGTLDELCELLTLVQTGKIRKHMPIVLYGQDYWNEVVNFEALARFGTIDPQDLDLLFVSDSVDETFEYLTEQLSTYGLPSPGPHL